MGQGGESGDGNRQNGAGGWKLEMGMANVKQKRDNQKSVWPKWGGKVKTYDSLTVANSFLVAADSSLLVAHIGFDFWVTPHGAKSPVTPRLLTAML